MTRLPRTLWTAAVAAAMVLAVPRLATQPQDVGGEGAVRAADAPSDPLDDAVGASLADATESATPSSERSSPDEAAATSVADDPERVAGSPPEVDHELSPEGHRVALGGGPVVGTFGEVRTYTVEVEPTTGVDLGAVLPFVREVLEDRERGWTSHGEVRLQWVDDVDRADFRVVVGDPDSVDRHCAEVGLETHGWFSCWDGERVMLNAWRWEHGAAHFGDDLETYRTYLVNHEVGHALGREHTGCPSPGEPAPIMMQQTLSVGECEPNGWPGPEGSTPAGQVRAGGRR